MRPQRVWLFSRYGHKQSRIFALQVLKWVCFYKRSCFSITVDNTFNKSPSRCLQRGFELIIRQSEIGLGGAVASWLVRSTPDQAVRVRDLAGDIALCSQALDSWVPANLMLEVTHPIQKYSQSLYATKTGISPGLMGHLARMQTQGYVINRVGKIPNCDNKQGKRFGRRAAHIYQIFVGVTPSPTGANLYSLKTD